MGLQLSAAHPHGLSGVNGDSLFTGGRRRVVGLHGFPGPVHRLASAATGRGRCVAAPGVLLGECAGWDVPGRVPSLSGDYGVLDGTRAGQP